MLAEVSEIFRRARSLGIKLEAQGDKLIYRPKSKTPPEFVDVLRQHKAELLRAISEADALCDLPFPIGYVGLPENEVTAALGFQDAMEISDPIECKLNVLMWIISGMAWNGDTGEFYQSIKAEYHRLRHADPTITEPCGICEYGDTSGHPS